MTHHEIEELLGASALDAVDRSEAEAVEAHLAECPRCRAEVMEHREVAALLSSGSTTAVPDGVWDRIAADLGDTPPPVPIEVAFGSRDQAPAPVIQIPRRRSPLLGLAAAAVVVVIALMGAVLVDQRNDLRDARDQVADGGLGDGELAALLSDPDTQLVALSGGVSEPGARALVGGDGDSVLLASALPELGAGQTYQLWGLPDGREEMVSLAVLGSNPDASEFHVEGGITTLAITREPGGGSTQPTTEPLVTGTFV